MGNITFVLNSAGVVEMLQSVETQAMLEGYAQQVAAGADLDTDIETLISGDRAAVRVYTANDRAAEKNAETNGLLKGLGHGSD